MKQPDSNIYFASIAQQFSTLAYCDAEHGIWTFNDDCLKFLDGLIAIFPNGLFDMIFADPPYFLSNGGISCLSGRMVQVDKGAWDKSRGAAENHAFNVEWLRRCQQLLKPNGTIWISGTQHVIYSVGYALQQLEYRILNDIVWEKPNPPPNLGCRCFTHSTETVLWAAKSKKSKHVFNYELMKSINGGKQMKSVWRMTSPASAEKSSGKHPTQKPLSLIERCLLASTNEYDLVLDPFLGSGTTAVACLQTNRQCVGIEADEKYIALASARLLAGVTDQKSKLF